MNPNIFRAFSIRGIADKDLPNDVAEQIGCAIGKFIVRRHGTKVIVGRDIRISSERISNAVVQGILNTGVSVHEVGVTPTPVVNFATDFYDCDGGIMITASHNPPEYNGLKIRTDTTLGKEEINEIFRLAQEPPCAPSDIAGFHHKSDPVPPYLETIMRRVDPDTRPLKIVIDCLDGTSGLVAPTLLRNLGHEVVELNCVPDGTFQNGTPDPTLSRVLDPLGNIVLEQKADIGFAYDGDGDRVAVVDELGRVVPGDRVLMLLARNVLLKEQTPANSKGVVYEVLCSQAVADDIAQCGGIPIVAPSGYFYVHHALQEHEALLGGELSGHFFFNDPDFRFDDSNLATIKILNILMQNDRPFSELVNDLPSYYSSEEIRLPCPDSVKTAIVDMVKQRYELEYPIETIDGVRVHFPNAWALVRQSNTQPIISMRFEAETSERLEAVQLEVESLVVNAIEQMSN